MSSTTTHGLIKPVGGDAVSVLRTSAGTNADTLDSYLLSTVTSLPGSPVDGQRCLFLADATNGVVWDLRYRSASGSTYKWEFIGGGELTAEVATNETTSSNSYGDLSTVGPTVTVPLAGDYEVDYSAQISAIGSPMGGFIVPKFGSASEDDTNDRAGFAVEGAGVAAASILSCVSRSVRRTVSTASTAVKLRYQAPVSTSTSFSRRTLSIRPIRVG